MLILWFLRIFASLNFTYACFANYLNWIAVSFVIDTLISIEAFLLPIFIPGLDLTGFLGDHIDEWLAVQAFSNLLILIEIIYQAYRRRMWIWK